MRARIEVSWMGDGTKLAMKETAKIGEMTMIRVPEFTEALSFVPDEGSPQEHPTKLHAHESLLYRHMHAAWLLHIV
jgi:hypothetical protein